MAWCVHKKAVSSPENLPAAFCPTTLSQTTLLGILFKTKGNLRMNRSRENIMWAPWKRFVKTNFFQKWKITLSFEEDTLLALKAYWYRPYKFATGAMLKQLFPDPLCCLLRFLRLCHTMWSCLRRSSSQWRLILLVFLVAMLLNWGIRIRKLFAAPPQAPLLLYTPDAWGRFWWTGLRLPQLHQSRVWALLRILSDHHKTCC